MTFAFKAANGPTAYVRQEKHMRRVRRFGTPPRSFPNLARRRSNGKVNLFIATTLLESALGMLVAMPTTSPVFELFDLRFRR